MKLNTPQCTGQGTQQSYPVLRPPAPPRPRNPGLRTWRGRKLSSPKCWGSLENHSDIQDIPVCHPSPFLFGACLLWPLLYGLNADPTLCGTSVRGSICWHYCFPRLQLHVYINLLNCLTFYYHSFSIFPQPWFQDTTRLFGWSKWGVEMAILFIKEVEKFINTVTCPLIAILSVVPYNSFGQFLPTEFVQRSQKQASM